MRYRYKTHLDIPPYMKDYLLSVVGDTSLVEVPVEDINDFLNGYDDWASRGDVSLHEVNYKDTFKGDTIH